LRNNLHKSIEKLNIWQFYTISTRYKIIDSSVTVKLVESIDKQIHEVIIIKGGPTDH